ncbi:MAG: ABC transporter permease [Planctomycetaceae bacterium]
MNLLTIAWKSIKQRGLASSLTSVSVALGVMLMVAVMVIHGIIDKMFKQQEIGYDLIVGPKGSDLQLVLSSVYRISPPIENVPYKYYEQIKNDKLVEVAIPIALGDTSDKGNFPIVGTTGEYFTTEYAPDKMFRARWKEGQQGFKTTLDAIIGAEVARRNNWDIGSTFKLVHSGQDAHVHNELFTVVGVLERTNTPNDKTVFIHLEGFYGIADHGKPFDEAVERLEDFFDKKYTPEEIEELRRDPKARKEVTAIFVRIRRPPDDPDADASFSVIKFQQKLNKGYKARAVNPIDPMKDLMDNVVGNVQMAVLILVALIIAVSGVSIFVSIYNSMADRKKEIAIMRALGARRQTVFAIILTESILLCVVGGLVGVLAGHGLVFAAAPIVEAKTGGLIIDPFAFHPYELILIPVLILMASLVGFIPGMTAYRTDVAETLGD